ncbi:MAG: type I 3-dehydroquinate dehydratase [Candidatus Hadarchaeales archaeon]
MRDLTSGVLRLGDRRIRTPAVCGSVMESTLEGMERVKRKAERLGADLLELRLDGLKDPPDWDRLLGGRLPVILTHRPEREGGGFRGGEEERVERLLEGVERGVPCLDLELSTPPRLLRRALSKARKEGTTVILSHHEFSGTPPLPHLLRTARRMERLGDLVKVVTLARSTEEVLRVLEFLHRARLSVPLVSFAMGELGTLSRILSALLGSPLVYASAGKPTAPGQLDVKTTRLLLERVRR